MKSIVTIFSLVFLLLGSNQESNKQETEQAKQQVKEEDANPLAKYLEVPGAKTTLPITDAKKGFSLEFVQDARSKFENFHYQMGGDHAMYYNLHMSEVMHTTISKPNEVYVPLEKQLDPMVGHEVKFTTKSGELTLNEYTTHPNHRVQGVMMIHKGKIVYETYPGMNPMDLHVWMSPGKATVGLIMAQLEETFDAILDPASIIVRFFSAEFGAPNPASGNVDNWLEILKDAEQVEAEKPGERNRYSSAVNQIFIVIAERIENKTWAELFEERVWGKMTARMEMQHNLTPDGTSIAHGLLSTTLEDFARFGMLFTPSWDKAALEPAVSAEVLKRIQTAGSPEAFKAGAKFEGVKEEFGEAAMANSFQFDAVFEDGALWKHGNLGKGIYIDPARDFAGVYFSTNAYIPPYGEDRMPGFLRRAAKYLDK